ncbi:hypothetical protein F5B19DRAFT_450485 [Rostrohypoxylon terebratum]|nr:hypothetical protein F5B19DRAFT_450485 [Rostrohypoxylon terebratum]
MSIFGAVLLGTCETTLSFTLPLILTLYSCPFHALYNIHRPSLSSDIGLSSPLVHPSSGVLLGHILLPIPSLFSFLPSLYIHIHPYPYSYQAVIMSLPSKPPIISTYT